MLGGTDPSKHVMRKIYRAYKHDYPELADILLGE
jgi:hypothetical protein